MKIVRTSRNLLGALLLLLSFAALPAIAQDAAAPAAPAASAPAAAAPAAAPAADAAAAPAAAPVLKLDSGDTAWMMTSVALVLMMTIPGLALFYGGMVRKKNVLATLMQSFAITCLVTVLWTIITYSLAFRANPNDALAPYIGGLDRFFLKGMEIDSISDLAKTIPESVYMCFQMTFAIITPALICGSFADRMKFSAMMWFMGLWAILVYAPVAHWVWGPSGFLGAAGVLDYAGGTVVHINAAVAGLVGAYVIGKRVGYGKEAMAPHNLPLTMIGASLLWVGWFGFNAGSNLEANGVAALAFVNTVVATSAATLAWCAAEALLKGKASMLGAASGAVSGLVAITPACGFVGVGGALVIGLVAGVICLWGVTGLKKMLGADDSLDVFGVHGVGGIVGALLTGVFASPALGGLGACDYVANTCGSFPGIGAQVWIQLQGVLYTVVLSGVVALVAFTIIKMTIGLRVTEDEEREGLDISSHGETAYNK